MCLSLFLNNVLQHYLKRDCDIDVFLWILRNFQEDRFFTEHLRIIAFELFWKFKKNIYSFFHKFGDEVAEYLKLLINPFLVNDSISYLLKS